MRFDPIDDYYRILGVGQEASLAELKVAFKKLALRHHPDKNRDRLEEAEAEFKKVKEAYDALSKLPKYVDNTSDNKDYRKYFARLCVFQPP